MVVQSLLLALAALFIRKVGATYVGAVGGLLTALGSPALGPFTFFFAFLYGVYVDVTIYLFRVKGTTLGVNQNRLIAAMTVSTLLIAISSYSAFAVFPEFFNAQGFGYISLFIQRSLMLDVLVLIMGPITGMTAGYTASYLWNKYLRNMAFKTY